MNIFCRNLYLYFRFCDRVIGIDVSPNQIAHAIKRKNVEYRCTEAENLSFLESNSVDLITIAAALHWLDIELFFKEVKRVLKPNTGVFAIWTYGIATLDNPIASTIYREFDEKVLLPYWDSKRWLGATYYQSILPLFPYQSTLAEHAYEQTMETSIGDLINFIGTLSACQTFRKKEGEKAYRELLETLRNQLIEIYATTSIQNNNDEVVDFNAIKFLISHPIRLYLMKKA